MVSVEETVASPEPVFGMDFSARATARPTRNGANELTAALTKLAWRLFLGRFASTMVSVLLAAGRLTAVIGDLTDATVIAAVTVPNVMAGFLQEHYAQPAMAALRRMTQPQARS